MRTGWKIRPWPKNHHPQNKKKRLKDSPKLVVGS